MQLHRQRTLEQSNYLKTAIRHGFSSFFFFFTVFLAGINPIAAHNSQSIAKIVDYLEQEKASLTLAISAADQTQPPRNENEYLKRLQENQKILTLNQAKISNFDSFLENQKNTEEDFTQRLRQLQQISLSSGPQQKSASVREIDILIKLNKKTTALIQENLSLAKHYQDILMLQKENLDLWKTKQSMHQRLEDLNNQEKKLNVTLTNLYEKNIGLQQKLKISHDFESNYAIEMQLLLNNQFINFIQNNNLEVELQKKLTKAEPLLFQNPDTKTLQKITELYKSSISQLAGIEQSLKGILSLLKKEQFLDNNKLKEQFTSLEKLIHLKVEDISIQQQTLQEDLENHQQELKKQLSVRQSLTEYQPDVWRHILSQLEKLPQQLVNYLQTLFLKVKTSYIWQDTTRSTIILSLLGLVVIAGYGFRKFLKQITGDKERSRLSGHLYDGILVLLNRNIPYLTAITALLLFLYSLRIPFSNYQLLVNLLFIWFIFRILILIARLILLERVTDASGKDVRLYYRIKWLLLAGGWATALMVISNQLPLSLLLQDIFNRLLMFFLLVVSLVAWNSKEVITHLLHPILKIKKRYFRSAVMLLVILAPLTLFTTAIIGLVGYINLAWTMSRYQVLILLIIAIYVLIRGLILDALDLLSEWMIGSLHNGWLWVEVFLKPLDKILRALLLILGIYTVFQLFDWHSDLVVVNALRRFSEYPLVNISGVHITTLSILEFILLLFVFIWIAKWTREFCYRWLYSDTKDPGIRNSLSVFTQYAVILIGTFITLRVLGLDFSGMSMVIGGLAVGMGFGLRDFASNIIGGLMLLIERPVREGDLITLGNYEGRVAHIGIRSMRVSSWDNMEVLIPNAETFNKPFTNWTHQDSIVRTVIPIKVSRADDPTMIQQLILDVLAIIPEIIDDPPAQVFLKQIDEALIEFEVRYFINVQFHTRFEIRSKVLFAITAQFKAAGIKAPIPPISVELKTEEREGE